MGIGKPSKTFQSRHDRVRQARLVNNIVVYGAIAVVVLVIVLVGYGAAFENLISPSQPIAEVNGEVITTGDFQGRVRFERAQLVNIYANTLTNIQFFAQSPEILNQINLQLDQIEQQMEPVSFGDQVLAQMIDEALVRQEAEKVGLTISDAEINAQLYSLFSFFPQGTSTPDAQATPLPTSTLSLTQYALITPTYTPTITPTLTATPPPEARGTSAVPRTPTPTTEGDIPAPATLTPVEPTATEGLPTLTPTLVTTQIFGDEYKTYLQGLADLHVDEQDLIAVVYNRLLLDKFLDTFFDQVPTEEEQVWLRQILVDDEATALEVLGKLESGQDWTELSIEYSQDSSRSETGGNLGWLGRDSLETDYSTEFAEAAFALDLGQISQPIETDDGWHIVQALGHEIRQLTAGQRDLQAQQLLSDWLEAARQSADISREDYWMSRIPRDPFLPVEQRQGFQQQFGITVVPQSP